MTQVQVYKLFFVVVLEEEEVGLEGENKTKTKSTPFLGQVHVYSSAYDRVLMLNE